MKLSYLINVVLWSAVFLASHYSYAQISPGDLSAAHEHLEGLSNCTQCHTLGDKVSNDKCLQCHDHLNARVSRGLGYHASVEVKGKDCFQCHSEHHGRKFEMIRFDKESFDHNLTGYPLRGQHAQIDCRQCHQADNIIDYEIREIEETYLGLTSECLLCHDDFHQNTLSPKCTDCHGFESFSPAVNFDHNEDSDYSLIGQHANVDCKECHVSEIRGGQEFRVFKGVEHSNCTSCHEDVHDGRLGSQCKACHTESGFAQFSGGKGFNHSITEFNLRGQHAKISCTACHDIGGNFQTVFADHRQADIEDCRICHDDAHEGKFGIDCKECHNESSWRIGDGLENFNHGLTDFELIGKHATVDCRECHTADFTTPLPHEKCVSCHSDYHEGRLVSDVQVVDCQRCHSEVGFENHTYSIDDHDETDFPLTGAHLATPCFACHASEEDVWEFDALESKCTHCHDNVHEGTMDPKYYRDKECTACHSTEFWADITFDHGQTGFDLEGQHAIVECKSCHFKDKVGESEAIQVFTGLERECYICHEDVHKGQFSDQGVTQCSQCHSPRRWKPSNFDHDSTRFPLEGAHEVVECNACHLPEMVDGEEWIIYKIDKFECVDCHL